MDSCWSSKKGGIAFLFRFLNFKYLLNFYAFYKSIYAFFIVIALKFVYNYYVIKIILEEEIIMNKDYKKEFILIGISASPTSLYLLKKAYEIYKTENIFF